MLEVGIRQGRPQCLLSLRLKKHLRWNVANCQCGANSLPPCYPDQRVTPRTRSPNISSATSTIYLRHCGLNSSAAAWAYKGRWNLRYEVPSRRARCCPLLLSVVAPFDERQTTSLTPPSGSTRIIHSITSNVASVDSRIVNGTYPGKVRSPYEQGMRFQRTAKLAAQTGRCKPSAENEEDGRDGRRSARPSRGDCQCIP
jgi:hypothetical protein